jgi:hypothetical protein
MGRPMIAFIKKWLRRRDVSARPPEQYVPLAFVASVFSVPIRQH